MTHSTPEPAHQPHPQQLSDAYDRGDGPPGLTYSQYVAWAAGPGLPADVLDAAAAEHTPHPPEPAPTTTTSSASSACTSRAPALSVVWWRGPGRSWPATGTTAEASAPLPDLADVLFPDADLVER